MMFTVASGLTLALVASSNVGVYASRELQVKLVDTSGISKVSDLAVAEMPCVGEPAGRTQKCVRPDGTWWGCEEPFRCVMKNAKTGKCLAPEDDVPTDSPAWKEKNKAVVCSSRGEETPIQESTGKTFAAGEGESCPQADFDKGCECAGARWRCADACNLIAKSCDEGLSCLRKTNNAYAICATQEMIDQRGQTDIYDPTPVPCGENVGSWNLLPGTDPFVPGPMTGEHAGRCEDEKKKHEEHGHGDGHGGERRLSWVDAMLGSQEKEFWDDEPEWHQVMVEDIRANMM